MMLKNNNFDQIKMTTVIEFNLKGCKKKYGTGHDIY